HGVSASAVGPTTELQNRRLHGRVLPPLILTVEGGHKTCSPRVLAALARWMLGLEVEQWAEAGSLSLVVRRWSARRGPRGDAVAFDAGDDFGLAVLPVVDDRLALDRQERIVPDVVEVAEREQDRRD